MDSKDNPGAPPRTRTTVSLAFERDEAPGALSVGIVSLVELCKLAMPDPAKIRERLREAEFEVGGAQRAAESGRKLALDNKLIASPIRNLKHEVYAKVRSNEPVYILLSVGDSDRGQVVFCSAIFEGAIEADAVKAASHVTKRRPMTGASVRDSEGQVIRRVFWDANGEAGIRGLVVSGPDDIEAIDSPRAFIAFNEVAAKQ